MSDILQDTPVPGVCRLTLNRPDKLNAFTYPMYAEFIEILERLRFDAEARVVILTGAGRGFCSGHDVLGAGEPPWAAPDLGKAQSVRAIVAKLGEIPTRLRGLPQPVICAVNGVTAGLGYSLALAADVTLAVRSALRRCCHSLCDAKRNFIGFSRPRRAIWKRQPSLLTRRALPPQRREGPRPIFRKPRWLQSAARQLPAFRSGEADPWINLESIAPRFRGRPLSGFQNG